MADVRARCHADRVCGSKRERYHKMIKQLLAGVAAVGLMSGIALAQTYPPAPPPPPGTIVTPPVPIAPVPVPGISTTTTIVAPSPTPIAGK